MSANYSWFFLFNVFLPLSGSAFCLFLRDRHERWISLITKAVLTAQLVAAFVTAFVTLTSAGHAIEYQYGTLIELKDYSFPLVMYSDRYSVAYLLMAALLTNLTIRYSRVYLHREAGYRRYFSLILLMLTGTNLMALSGTLDLFFAGWELIGLSSFLLIGFYWRRNMPVNHSLMAFTVYRICDVGLLAATVLTHLMIREGGLFSAFAHSAQFSSEHSPLVLMLATMMVFASLGKSSQFPFLNWLPRAMEGPTPSSAVFYGALSIHAGLILLIRTESVWRVFPSVAVVVGGVGFLSVVLGSLIERTISNIKGQLAYSSIVQVGLMFIEVSLGWKDLAIAHMVVHSFFRAYQILISPSFVAHRLRLMSLKDYPPEQKRLLFWQTSDALPTLYAAALNEFFLWPSKSFSILIARNYRKNLHFLDRSLFTVMLLVGVAFGLTVGGRAGGGQAEGLTRAALYSCGIAMLISVVAALNVHQTPVQAWRKVGLSVMIGVFMTWILGPEALYHVILPHFGFVAIAWILGMIAIRQVNHHSMAIFHGRLGTHARDAVLFLIAIVVVTGMPLSPTFIAEDILLHWAFERDLFLTFVLTASLSFVAVATAKIFTRVFLGGRP